MTSAATMLRSVYLVTSGSYDDYKVHRAYADQDAAEALVRRVNERDIRRKHDANVAAGYVPPNAQYTCRDPIETCPGCAPFFDPLNWSVRVEAVRLAE